MRKPKIQSDKMLFDSPILDEIDDSFLVSQSSLAVSGQINIGKSGNPVTIFIEDEETGEILEVNHVKTALLVIEDSRKSTSGWLSVALGSLPKLSEVLQFIAKITLEGLEKMTKGR